MYTVVKSYRDLPAAHRQPKHDGHCSLIHGHNWGFDIEFSCRELDACGFVVDVGKLKWLKLLLEEKFDHTLLLNEDDPMLPHLKAELEPQPVARQLANIIVVPKPYNCGMEGLAHYVYFLVNQIIGEHDDTEDLTQRGVVCIRVTCWEDAKNSATYLPE